MLKKTRVALAAIFFLGITLLFLDFTGTLHGFLGWMAKVQFLPAVLALNAVVIVAMLLLTILFGRVYCSVICPLGVFQDGVAWLSRKGRKGKYTYSKEVKWLRYGVWVLFVAALIAGIGSFVALLAPYSAWGRIVQNLLSPVYQWVNNILAAIAERRSSYAFYSTEVWLRSLPTFLVAAITFVVLVVLAWKNGRTYCNTVCPVGTTLSFFSRFAMFRPVIDAGKCRSCRVCEKRCKASCIDIAEKKIDYSRCVDCFNCIDNCKFGALKYRFAWKGASAAPAAPTASATPTASAVSAAPAAGNASRESSSSASSNAGSGNGGQTAGAGRRAFLVGAAVALTGTALRAQTDSTDTEALEKENEGGFADIIPKKAPKRSMPVTPFGSRSVKEFYDHCTACQLCVAVCPNNVLRPSSALERLMQPEMSFERGYCRPECTKCSEVCPAGAILRITPEEKTAWKVGTAHLDYDLCIVANGEVDECGNCARHCPAGAIMMIAKDPDSTEEHKVRIPAVDGARCIGCGACENLCPARPLSAITVDGYAVHHTDVEAWDGEAGEDVGETDGGQMQ